MRADSQRGLQSEPESRVSMPSQSLPPASSTQVDSQRGLQSEPESGFSLHDVLVNVAAPLLTGVAILALVLKNGKHLVNKPQLCPQLATTWRK